MNTFQPGVPTTARSRVVVHLLTPKPVSGWLTPWMVTERRQLLLAGALHLHRGAKPDDLSQPLARSSRSADHVHGGDARTLRLRDRHVGKRMELEPLGQPPKHPGFEVNTLGKAPFSPIWRFARWAKCQTRAVWRSARWAKCQTGVVWRLARWAMVQDGAVWNFAQSFKVQNGLFLELSHRFHLQTRVFWRFDRERG